jgi:hypothetical protein
MSSVLPGPAFYMLALNCDTRPVPNGVIEGLLSSAEWLRFNKDTYFFVSYIGLPTWQTIIRPALHANDTFLFVRIDPTDRLGWVPQVVVDWFRKHGG